ncbi:carbohydrate kinase family protein [Candidatus Woesearchaeota archaeon]|nr:carbohydrate kinase family protein [Candidatus Woesearchaeota archaeon]
MVKIAVIGHFVKDYWISAKRDFSKYNPEQSIDEVLSLASNNGDIINSSFGGTALTWTQYLIPKHEVSPISVLGNDNPSREIKEILDLHESINQEGIKTYAGSIPRFVLVFPERPQEQNHRKFWKSKVYWEGRMADKNFPKVEISPQFLGAHDVLVLPITEPLLALQAAKSFLSQNPSGKIVYNPGRYLHGFGLSLEGTNFQEIVNNYATSLLLNGQEVGVVQSGLHLGNISRLFRSGRRLELILHTKDRKGSVVYERKTSKKYEPSNVNPLFVDPSFELGAGDAYGAIFHRKHLKGDSIDEALECATRGAEHCLTFPGALCRQRIIEGTYTDSGVKVANFRM